MADYKADITEYLEREIETIRELDVEEINRALNLLQTAFENENTVYIFGTVTIDEWNLRITNTGLTSQHQIM